MKISFDDFGTTCQDWPAEILRNPRQLEQFAQCKSDSEKFELAEIFVGQKLNKLQPKVEFEGKNTVLSVNFRNQGNDCFANGNFPTALRLYNLALVYAPWPNKDAEDFSLAFAFGNRSSVFFKMQRFAECLKDVDAAISFGYPKNKVKKLVMRKAEALVSCGHYSEAKAYLEEEGRRLGICDESGTWKNGGEGCADYVELWKSAEEKSKRNRSQPLKPTYTGIEEMEMELENLKLKNGSHQMFPVASADIDFKYTPEAGRYFVAKEDFKTGDVILKEPFFMHITNDKFQRTNCYACLMFTDSALPCPKCAGVVFCSQKCADSWKAKLHEKECSFWRSAYMCDLAHSQIYAMVLRTLLTKSPAEWKAFMSTYPGNVQDEADEFKGIPNLTYESLDYANVFCMVKNVKKHSPEANLTFSFYAVFLLKVLELNCAAFAPGTMDEELRNFIGGVAIRHIMNFLTNRVAVKDALAPYTQGQEQWRAHSSCVYATYALFNSTCDPNLSHIQYGDTVVVRASRPIQKGELLSRPSASVYHALNLKDRQNLVKVQSFYKCECRPCVENWPMKEELQKMDQSKWRMICPFCRTPLGKFPLQISKCPKCNASSGRIETAVQEGRELTNKINLSGSRTEQMSEIFAALDAMYRVFEPPNPLLYLLQDLAFTAMLFAGNKRYDGACDDYVRSYQKSSVMGMLHSMKKK